MCFLACVILRFTSGATPADCMEYDSRAFLIHELTDVSASIGGGSGWYFSLTRCTYLIVGIGGRKSNVTSIWKIVL